MTKPMRNWKRRVLGFICLLGVLASCHESPVKLVGDAMTDVGEMLQDSGTDAAAQPTETVINVTCDQMSQSTITQSSGVVYTTTTSYALVAVPDPVYAVVERCGFTTTAAPCPAGATCAGANIAGNCQRPVVEYTGTNVVAICGTSTSTALPGGSTTTTTSSWANVRVRYR